MHSWVFRNRERLRLIYGAPPPALSAPRVEPEAADRGAGRVVRRRRWVVLRPMPRQAS